MDIRERLKKKLAGEIDAEEDFRKYQQRVMAERKEQETANKQFDKLRKEETKNNITKSLQLPTASKYLKRKISLPTTNNLNSLAERNSENAQMIAKAQNSAKRYNEIQNELIKNTVEYQSNKIMYPNMSEEELIKKSKKDVKATENKIIHTMASSPVSMNTMVSALPINEQKYYKTTALKYKTQKEAQEEAERINKDIENGNYGSAIGHVLAQVPIKAGQAVNDPIIATGSLLNNKDFNKKMGLKDGDEVLQNYKTTSQRNDLTTSQIDNDIVRNSSRVSGTIGYMIPSILVSAMAPESNLGRIAQGISVAGSSYNETLNEDSSNKLQSLLTGAGKGYASYAIEGLFGGNILGKGSLDDMATNLIATKVGSKIGQKIASKIYQYGGETVEELLENNVDYLLDKVINNKGISLREYLEEQGQTTTDTIATTLILDLLGLGGNVYNDVQNYEMNQWINEAEKIIDKENLTLTDEKLKTISNQKEVQNVLNQLQQEEPINNVQGQQEQANNTINTQTQQIMQEQNKVAENELSGEINIEKEYQTFKNSKNNISRNTVSNIADSINVPLKEGSEYVYDTEMSKRAGNNINPKITNIDKIFEGITKNNITSFRDKAFERALSLFRDKKVTIKDTNTKAEINKSGLNETFSKVLTEEKMQSANNLDEIISEGIYKYSTQDIDNKDGIIYHNFYSVVSYNNENHLMRIVIKEFTKNRNMNDKFYFHTVEEINNIKSEGNNSFLPRKNGSKTVELLPFINNSITSSNENVKPTNYSMQNGQKNTQILPTPNKTMQDVGAPKNTAQEQNISYNLPIDEKTKSRRHYKSIVQSQYITDEAKKISKDLMKTDTYVPESNNKQLERADRRIELAGADSELESLLSRAMTGGNIKADDIAVGERLIQYYSKTGNKAKLQDAIQATAMAGTTAGQTVQALSLLNHQTPEGQAVWLQRSVEKMNNDLKRTRGEKAEQFNLTPEMTEKIVNSKNNEELQNNLNDVYKELGQQVTKTIWQKIDSWRYFAMLANPRTHIRNIVGNVSMAGVQTVKNKIAGGIEAVVNKFNPEIERTHTIIPASEEIKQFAKNDIKNVSDRLGLSQNKYNPKTRLENSMKTFKTDALEKTIGRAYKINDNALETEDGVGLKHGYVKALSEYMTANKLTPEHITDKQLSKARNYAVEQARQATFHQDARLASLLNQLSNKNKFSKFMLDAIVPYKKTPINIAKEGMNYSPVGLVYHATMDIKKVRNGEITVNQYIDNVSKGLTGTGIALVGYALASAGILSASGSDDEDKQQYEEALGNQTYSIKIGDNTYSLDWIAPSGIPLFIGAEIYEIMQQQKEIKTSSTDDETAYNQAINSAVNILDAFTNAMNPMTEMSMLSGLSSALKSYEQGASKTLAGVGINATKSYINQFIPTALRQIAKTTDEYERTTTSTKTGTLPKAVDSTKNYIMSSIPGLRQLLPIKTDTWGNQVKQSENVVQRALENSVFPWTRKEITTTKVDNEIISVYNNTGESSVLPDNINKNLTINKQKYLMTSEEYAKYQKEYGKNSYNLLNKLVNSTQYKKLKDSQKQIAIEKVYEYAKEQIKIDYAKNNNLNYEESRLSETLNALKKSNANTSNYLEYIALTKDMDKTSEKITVLASSDFTDKTKQVIYENYIKSENDSQYGAVKASGMNITEYLKFKTQEFESDKKDDGTLTGQTVSNSKKKKIVEYLNSMKITGNQRLLLYAMQGYTTTASQKTQLANYVQGLDLSKREKLKLYDKFSGFTVYKNGTVRW